MGNDLDIYEDFIDWLFNPDRPINGIESEERKKQKELDERIDAILKECGKSDERKKQKELNEKIDAILEKCGKSDERKKQKELNEKIDAILKEYGKKN